MSGFQLTSRTSSFCTRFNGKIGKHANQPVVSIRCGELMPGSLTIWQRRVWHCNKEHVKSDRSFSLKFWFVCVRRWWQFTREFYKCTISCFVLSKQLYWLFPGHLWTNTATELFAHLKCGNFCCMLFKSWNVTDKCLKCLEPWVRTRTLFKQT